MPEDVLGVEGGFDLLAAISFRTRRLVTLPLK
jgi:hypothetical protein